MRDQARIVIMKGKLMTHLDNILPPGFIDYLEGITIVRPYEKGRTILSPGNLGNKAWLIRKGAAKMFNYDSRGKQHISYLFSEGEIMLCINSFFAGQAADAYIVLLEDCELMAVTKDQLVNGYPDREPIGDLQKSILLEYIRKMELKVELLTLPAKERYQMFRNLYKRAGLLVNDLSSYLHLDRSYLSVIMNNA